MERRSEEITKKIFDLYRKYGSENYIGEEVTQIEHMTQCAMLAEKEGFSDDVILGVFFHDIGHLLGLEQDLPRMGNLGVQHHDTIGEKYLKDLGFKESVTKMVWGHVQAKRYLVHKYDDYYDKLSDASKGTLEYQGGSMTPEEAEQFENLPVFKALIRMRHWDDEAKVKDLPIEPLEKYEQMCTRYLNTCLSN